MVARSARRGTTVGSVILAGILLKVGGYGLLRFLIPIFPVQVEDNLVMLQLIGVLTAVYGFAAALVQVDVKKIVAYSSIGHMAFVLLGAITYTAEGIESSVLTMITHGFVSGAMFTCVGFLYDRYKTRNVFAYGGLVAIMPKAATFVFLFVLGNIAFPGTGSFIAELGTFVAISKMSLSTTCWVLLATVIGAAYNLWLYVRVFMGPAYDAVVERFADFNDRESFVLTTFAVLSIFSGIFPEFFLSAVHTFATQSVASAVVF